MKIEILNTLIKEALYNIKIPQFKHIEDKGHIGLYDDSAPMVTPDGKKVSIDNPLVDEIKWLWSLGVETTGCCSGHGVYPSYIGVTDEYIPYMIALGYEVQINTSEKGRPCRNDSFFSKSVKTTDKMMANYVKSINNIIHNT